jgi:hypothetical protein
MRPRTPPPEATRARPQVADTTRGRPPVEATRGRIQAEATRRPAQVLDAEDVVPAQATQRRPRRADIEVEPATRPRGFRPPRRGSRSRFAIVNGIADRFRALFAKLGAALTPAWEFIAPVREKVAAGLAVVSELGWTLVGATAVCWFVAAWFDWQEFAYLAAFGLILVVVCILFTIGRLKLEVHLELEPTRVVVGESAAAQLALTNLAATPVLPFGLEVPVGQAVAKYTTPVLAPGAEHSEIAVIPTGRRGVINVGPVRSQRGDPFGVLRRELAWTGVIELFIHPKTVALEPLGAGMLRDLEGRTTNDVSMSDLAFHTLREYEPGDDRRYIHWRSSAKMSAAAGTSKFMVRQFLDTRRSHIAVILDVNDSAYADPDDFELACSAGASIAVRALTDDMDLTLVCGQYAVTQPPPHTALDTFSRAELCATTLTESVGKLNQIAPDVSVALFVTGSQAEFSQLVKAKAYLPPEVATTGLVAHQRADLALREVAGMPVMTVGNLRDLPRLMATEAV